MSSADAGARRPPRPTKPTQQPDNTTGVRIVELNPEAAARTAAITAIFDRNRRINRRTRRNRS